MSGSSSSALIVSGVPSLSARASPSSSPYSSHKVPKSVSVPGSSIYKCYIISRFRNIPGSKCKPGIGVALHRAKYFCSQRYRTASAWTASRNNLIAGQTACCSHLPCGCAVAKALNSKCVIQRVCLCRIQPYIVCCIGFS